jgi:hypothetical protein
MKNLYIITRNHNDKRSIKEFGGYFKKNFKLKYSEKIKKNNTNLILEEFTKYEFREQLQDIKTKYPRTLIGCIFTEYYHSSPSTFNNFDKNVFKNFIKYTLIYNILFLILDFLIKNRIIKKIYYLKNLILKIFKNFSPPILTDIIKKELSKFDFTRKFFSTKHQFKISYIFSMRQSFYFFIRFKYFSRIVDYIDFYLSWNTQQKKKIENSFGKPVYFFLPKINIIKCKNRPGITISGSRTSYREDLLKKILKLNFKLFNNFNNFLLKKQFQKKNIYTQYSFNPGKFFDWNEPSLIRYIFSINNNEIPIIVAKYDDKIYKNACLYFNLNELIKKKFIQLSSYKKNLKIINNKIIKFNTMSKKLNRNFFNFIKINE